MKFTLGWLKDHLDTRADIHEIADALTDLGLEVEQIEDPAASYGNFRICRVLNAEKHPNADRLTVCQVETWPDGPDGSTETVQVVCGAPNARAGLVGIFAPPGSHMPGTGVDLKKGVIRGVESNGMLCSERELMISDDHDGIIDLPENATPGERFVDYFGLNDPVIEIAVTPNRPDALGVHGIARDLAARKIGQLKPLGDNVVPGVFKCPISVSIDEDLRRSGCPAFFGRLVRGVKNGPSPAGLRARLEAIGLRPISALVDVTNFVTYDLNRPIHAFDADKVAGNLRVHWGNGEEIEALDKGSYRLDSGTMVISDDNGAESIAGIMGGMSTGCTQETTNVFIESAYWDPVTIARTGRKLNLISDARYRFERGVDPCFTRQGLEVATSLVLEFCGGEASDIVFDGGMPENRRAIELEPHRTSSLVGMEVSTDRQVQILDSLGFEPRIIADRIVTLVPSWRPDIHGEADLVEEIARVSSLSRLRSKPLERMLPNVPKPILTPSQKRERRARRVAASLGYNECVTYSFIERKLASLFGGGKEATELQNPISSEMSHLRPDLLPGLLQAVARNQARGFGDLALFEVGPVFSGGEPNDQSLQAAGLLVGGSAPRHPGKERRSCDVFDAKADAEAILHAVGAPASYSVMRETPSWWHPGRSGTIRLGPRNVLACFGELNPRVVKGAGVKGDVMAFSVQLDAIPYPRSRSIARKSLQKSDLQAVERDYAFVVDEQVEASRVVAAARGGDSGVIESVFVFDEFAGAAAAKRFGEGKKSLAISVRYQPVDKTLTESMTEALGKRVVDRVYKATGGTLRKGN